MSYFEFPHTRSYDGDLGYIIKRLEELTAKYGEFMKYNQIIFANPIDWNINITYPAWNIVFADNGYYIAVKPVPAGIMINNTDYWELIIPFKIDTILNANSFNPIANKPVAEAIANQQASILDILSQVIANSNAIHTNELAISAESTARITETTSLSQDLTTLTGRVDNIAQTIVPGGTTGDAELADIRLGYNGVTYATAGDAVRAQANILQKEVDNTNTDIAQFWKTGKNLYDRYSTNKLVGYYVTYNSGLLVTNASQTCVAVPVIAGNKVCVNVHFTQVAFTSNPIFDLTSETVNSQVSGFISGALSDGTTYIENLTVPNGARFMIVSISNLNVGACQVEYGATCTTYEPYSLSIDGGKIKIASIPEDRIVYDSSNVYNFTLKDDGTGDYSNLRTCIEAINALESYDKATIHLTPGTYDLRAMYTNTEWNGAGFVGLMIPRNVSIIGDGDNRNDVVLTCTSEISSELISALNFTDNIDLENVTMYGDNLRYIIHDDFSDFEFANEHGNYRHINNVDFIGENLIYSMPYGAGTKGGANWTFNNCRFIYKDNGMCFSVHDSTSATPSTLPEKIVFNNCEFIGYGVANVRLCPAVGSVEETVIFNGCKLRKIYVTSQFTGGDSSTTVYNILGSGNTPNVISAFYNAHDKLSVIRFSDQVRAGINTSGATFSIGDYVKIDQVLGGIIAGTSSDNNGRALNSAIANAVVYFE